MVKNAILCARSTTLPASTRETILAALHARLTALSATALRGEVLPERVPAAGLLILRDGEPEEGGALPPANTPSVNHFQGQGPTRFFIASRYETYGANFVAGSSFCL